MPLKNRRFQSFFIAVSMAFLWAILPVSSALAQSTEAPPRSPGLLTIQGNRFELGGQPFQILSGSIHYARVPRQYWRARLHMARAMGLNTVTTYVFWNLHEPRPGVYDFSGDLNVAEFIREAQQEGLNVILRPGPYACAEWELGGYPAWLLANPKIKLRSNDPSFMIPAERWMLRLGQELAPLQAGRGGPIIAVQLENEYGSFGSDKAYLAHWRQILLQAGFTKALMFTADGSDRFQQGNLPGTLAVVNGGVGEAKKNFAALAAYQPGKPLMTAEYWDGWFDHWGQPHVVIDQQKAAVEYAWMLDQGYSVNLYMFHGGTSFGFMNGANIDKGVYYPTVTSYDYDAPLDESGRPTPLFFTFRKILAVHSRTPLPAVPATPPTIAIPPFPLTESIALANVLPAPVPLLQPVPIEMLGQSYGYALYRTRISTPVEGDLFIENVHDYAQVYVNGALVGTLDRRLDQHRLPLHITQPNSELDILVENTGRVNFSLSLRDEWQGIFGQATLAGAPLTGWQVFSIPMTDPGSLPFSSAAPVPAATGPVFYRGHFSLEHPGDTFLDLRSLHKGMVWVNGHALGRFWDIGPQRDLYVPGPWLKTGDNTVIVFDLTPQPGMELSGLPARLPQPGARKLN